MLKVLFRLCSIQLMWPLRKMSRYLKHFTAVGDEQSTAGQWHEEEPHDASEDIQLATGQHLDQVSFRDSLRRLYRTERFQVNDHTLDIYINTYIFFYINERHFGLLFCWLDCCCVLGRLGCHFRSMRAAYWLVYHSSRSSQNRPAGECTSEAQSALNMDGIVSCVSTEIWDVSNYSVIIHYPICWYHHSRYSTISASPFSHSSWWSCVEKSLPIA